MGDPASITRMFQAFGDPLRMLHLLRQRKMCVGDLVEVPGGPQPTASPHLRRLRDAGLVELRHSGRWWFHVMAAPTSCLHERLLECPDSRVEEVPAFRHDAARLHVSDPWEDVVLPPPPGEAKTTAYTSN